MLNFGSKELLINSNLPTNSSNSLELYDAAGAVMAKTSANAATAAKIRIWGFGDIEKSKVTKATFNRGVVGSKQVTTVDLAGGYAAPLIEKTVRMEVVIKDGSYDAQYAQHQLEYGRNPKSYQLVVKPGQTAAQCASQLASLIQFEASRYGNETLTASVAGSILTLSTGSNFSHPEEVKFSVKFKDEDALMDYDSVIFSAPVITTVPAKLSINSAEWLRENLRLITDVTTMPYWAPFNDQLPVAGAYYSSFNVECLVERPELTGLSAVGQVVVSKKELDVFVKEDAQGAAIAANSFIHILATFLDSAPNATKVFLNDTGAVAADLAGFLA